MEALIFLALVFIAFVLNMINENLISIGKIFERAVKETSKEERRE